MLLTGARLARPAERYTAAKVAGPHVRQLGRRVFITSPSALGRQLGQFCLRMLPSGLAARLRRARHRADMVLGAFPTAEDTRWCARAVARLKPQAMLIDTIFRTPLLAEPELRGLNSIIISHDIFHRRAMAMQAAGYSVQPRDLTRAREAVLLGRASSIAAIQPDEAAIIRAMCPDVPVFTAPMPALPCPPLSGTTRITGRLVFVGSASLPNLDGMRWFFSEIWPLLGGHGITLDIIGDCGTALRRLPPGVMAYGRVPELAPYLHRAALAVAPLRAGSGLKIKLLDYARHGLATVVTPPALAGFEASPASPYIIAGSAVMFAEAVHRSVQEPPSPEMAIDYCTRHYGEEASFAGLKSALLDHGGHEKRTHMGIVQL